MQYNSNVTTCTINDTKREKIQYDDERKRDIYEKKPIRLL